MAVGMLNGALYCLLRVHLIAKAALGPGFSGGPAAGARPAVRGRGHAVHPDPVEPEAAARLFERGARGDHGGGPGAGRGGRDLRRPAPHDLPHAREAAVVLLGGDARAAPRSSDFEEIGPGTLGRTPVASALFVLAAVILTGSPPFGLFFSEMTILKAGFAGPHTAVIGVFLACLVLLFCGFFYQVGRMVLGEQPAAPARAPDAERFDAGSPHDALRRDAGGRLGFLSAPGPPGPDPRGGARGGGRPVSAARDMLRERLGLDSLAEVRPGEFVAQVELTQLPEVADRAAGAGLRLASLFATDEGPARGFAVHHLWASAAPAGIRARVGAGRPRTRLASHRSRPSTRWPTGSSARSWTTSGRRPRVIPTRTGSRCTTTGRRAPGRCGRTSTTGSPCRAWEGSSARIGP